MRICPNAWNPCINYKGNISTFKWNLVLKKTYIVWCWFGCYQWWLHGLEMKAVCKTFLTSLCMTLWLSNFCPPQIIWALTFANYRESNSNSFSGRTIYSMVKLNLHSMCAVFVIIWKLKIIGTRQKYQNIFAHSKVLEGLDKAVVSDSAFLFCAALVSHWDWNEENWQTSAIFQKASLCIIKTNKPLQVIETQSKTFTKIPKRSN